MAKRILIFDSDGNNRFAIDWRHKRQKLTAILSDNMQPGDVAIEVTPTDNESLEGIMASVHRCRAQVKGGLIEAVHWFQCEPDGSISARTRIRMPDQFYSEMAGQQYTRGSNGIKLHSRKTP